MSPLVRALLAAAVAAGLLAALGFGLTRNPTVLESELVGSSAPPFELTGIDGAPVTLDGYRQGRPAVINFWASWCVECKKEHPLLMEAHSRYGEQVAFVGVVFQDSAANASRFLVDMGDVPAGSYPNLLDPGSRTAIDYGVYGVPETFFVDRNGRIVSKRIGRVTPDLLEQELRRLVQ